MSLSPSETHACAPATTRGRGTLLGGVVLLAGVGGNEGGELGGQGVFEDSEPLVVVVGELDVEDIRNNGPVSIQDAGAVIYVTLQGGSKFDGLNFRLECLGESPVDHPVQGVFELLQQTHLWMLLPRPWCVVEPDRSAQGEVVGSPTMTEMRACTLSTLPTAVGWARVAE